LFSCAFVIQTEVLKPASQSINKPNSLHQLFSSIGSFFISLAHAEENICLEFELDGNQICFLGQALDSTEFEAELAAEQDALTNASSRVQAYLAIHTGAAAKSIERTHIEQKLKSHMKQERRLVTRLGKSTNKSFVQVVYSMPIGEYLQLRNQLAEYINELAIKSPD
ncbi:MAG: hypothetical protein ACPGYX_08280, partial [Oceanobacter sp.]